MWSRPVQASSVQVSSVQAHRVKVKPRREALMPVVTAQVKLLLETKVQTVENDGLAPGESRKDLLMLVKRLARRRSAW